MVDVAMDPVITGLATLVGGGMAATMWKFFFGMGKLATVLESNTRAIEGLTKSQEKIQEKMQEDLIRDAKYHKLTHEDARKFLHYHDCNGVVCSA